MGDGGHGVAQVAAERRLAVRPGGDKPEPARAAPARAADRNSAAARPWYPKGSGGMVSQASSVSRATMPSASPRSKASANRPATSRSHCGVRQRGPVAPAGRQLRGDSARASDSALSTASAPQSRISAASAARNPSTSHSTRAARCRGGRCCRAATKTSDIDSRAAYLVPRAGPPSNRWSDGLKPGGRQCRGSEGDRPACQRPSGHRAPAGWLIRESHARSARALNPSNPRQAAISVC